MLVDVRLPDGDGIEFWKEACLPNTQVVFMTGHSSTDSAVEALSCGAADYLRKPISLHHLRAFLSVLNASSSDSPPSARAGCFAKLIERSTEEGRMGQGGSSR